MTPPENPFRMPVLATGRLLVRPLARGDLDRCCALFAAIGWDGPEPAARRRRASWLRWTIDGYRELERLYQPPLGERAVAARDDGRLVGLAGYVPSFEPFGRLAPFGGAPAAGRTMELGLFWAIDPAEQRRGFATEAAGALVRHAFDGLAVARIVATTRHDNHASVAVMRRLGMQVAVHDQPHPGLQVVGVLDRDGRTVMG